MVQNLSSRVPDSRFGDGATAGAQALPKLANPVGTTSRFLGVGIQEIDSDRAKELKLPEGSRRGSPRVATDSPAEKAGIKTGDAWRSTTASASKASNNSRGWCARLPLDAM